MPTHPILELTFNILKPVKLCKLYHVQLVVLNSVQFNNKLFFFKYRNVNYKSVAKLETKEMNVGILIIMLITCRANGF